MKATKIYLEKHSYFITMKLDALPRQAGQACLDVMLKDVPLLSKRVDKAWSCEL